MALTDAQWAAEVADVVAELIAGTITEAQAAARLKTATEDWPTRTLSNADLAARVSRFLARLNGLILTNGPPDVALGELNTFAYDTVNGALYGPKTAGGWGTPVSLVGPPGAGGVISGVSISMLAPGSDPTVTLGGAPSDRTIAFAVPSASDGEDGDDGVTPNVSAAVTMIAAGEPALVTRSGPDDAPVFTFQLPRSADGTDGKEIELQPGATHLQWRYVGAPTWTNLFARSDFKGDKGDKGDAFEFDAKPADLAGRSVYDAEGEGFTVLVMDTGMVFARVGATPGVWSDGFPFGQTQNAILEALSELNGTPGLLYQSGPGTFEKRAIGVASDTDVPDRLAADGRYRLQGASVPLAEVSGAAAALDDKADAAATLVLLGGKEDKTGKGAANGYAGLGADGKVPTGQLPAPPSVPVAATAADVRAGSVAGKYVSPQVMADAFAQVTVAEATAAAGLDFAEFFNAIIPLTGNITLGAPANATPGKSGTISVSQDATGGRTMAFNAAYRLPVGGVTLQATGNGVTIIPFQIGAGGAVRLFAPSKWS